MKVLVANSILPNSDSTQYINICIFKMLYLYLKILLLISITLVLQQLKANNTLFCDKYKIIT